MKTYALTILLFLSSCGPMFLEGTNEEVKELAEAKTHNINFKNSNMKVNFSWIKGPFGDPSKESTFTIQLLDKSGKPRDLKGEQEFRFLIIMPSMGGHGPADYGRLKRLSKGLYLYKGLYLNMEGVWDIYIDLCKKNEVTCNENTRLDEGSLSFEIN